MILRKLNRIGAIAGMMIFSGFYAYGQTDAYTVSQDLFETYRARNGAESRLPEYRDDDSMLLMKLRQLAHINRSRERGGSAPVELDILASRVANRTAYEAAANGYNGHWNLRGEKPYHRYAFSGGFDHVSENAASVSYSAQFTRDAETYEKFMRECHDRFMAERPPHDGHRRTVLAPEHTAVGIGVAIVEKEFRYYEEFIDRYLEFVRVPASLKPGETGEIIVRPLSGKHLVQAVVAYYEPIPKPVTATWINKQGSYPDFTDKTSFERWPWELEPNGDGTWTIPFSSTTEGLHYLQIYLGTERFSGGSFSTKGKINGSGIIVRVER